MQRAIITPAVLPPAALTELKDWLGITTSTDDAQLTSLLRAALDLCEGFTGSMPLQQVCEAVLPVSAGWQDLPARPVQAITLVEGIPAEGARFAVPTADYALDLTADGGGRVRVLNPGAAGRIAVRFSAGLAADWSALPEALRHGAVRLAAHQYRQREGAEDGAMPPAAVAALWRPWRRLRLA
ncbi:phage head-tail connector protein [Novosphingobium sp.]|uniref:head-tail connector protein n=1 Tax=Novosphingobium sp. TaxID=1874826 RepID=UPI0027341849|nr:phage head-tail connector protein [Novosphingobium sp.]MDP3906339.1 phage head-tail connector protein [Novosphingobium sp.]